MRSITHLAIPDGRGTATDAATDAATNAITDAVRAPSSTPVIESQPETAAEYPMTRPINFGDLQANAKPVSHATG
ncbi:hypothetical protein ABH920_006582 [Catenulispora sp. EB89]|uniref:hypothetical protein n=1 Tax=Catenulispora sp. EB89 TaxID=3156257 RepID=UPI003516A7BF